MAWSRERRSLMRIGECVAARVAAASACERETPSRANIACAIASCLYSTWDDPRREQLLSCRRDDVPHAGMPLDLPESINPSAPAVMERPSFVLGSIYEGMLSAAPLQGNEADSKRARRARKSRGAFYTPPDVVDRAIELLGPVMGHRDLHEGALVVCDPACGSGNFLSAAARRWGGASSRAIALFGCDLDPDAAALARVALDMERLLQRGAINEHRWSHSIQMGDALVGRVYTCDGGERADTGRCPHHAQLSAAVQTTPMHWFDVAPAPCKESSTTGGWQWRGFDVLLGNPPYLSQLSALTVRSRTLAAYLHHASEGLIEGYADGAAAFLWRSIHLTRPGGSLCLVLPHTLFASRDAAPIRAFVEREAEVIAIEPVRAGAFDAGVSPVLVAMKRRTHTEPQTSTAVVVALRDEAPRSTLADIATAIADFRDEYYGLLPHVIDDPENRLDDARYPPVISCGLIDPGRSLWGDKPARLYKRLWTRPRANLGAMEQDQARITWARRRLVPKVLLATQTRTLEWWADTKGAALPVTPVISIIPRPGHSLDEIVRVLSSPDALSAARRLGLGTGLTPHVIKLSAKQVLQLPR